MDFPELFGAPWNLFLRFYLITDKDTVAPEIVFKKKIETTFQLVHLQK